MRPISPLKVAGPRRSTFSAGVFVAETRRYSRLLALAAGVALAAPGAIAEEPATGVGIDSLISGYRNAPRDERPQWLHRLCHAGADALSTTRAARDQESDDELHRGLAKAARWQLVDRLIPVLRAGLETQLTFDGQYSKLAEEGPETVGALFALLEDDTAQPELRLAASRALADIGDAKMLPRLRSLYYDILFPAFLREQVGILMAILGDTHTLDRQIRRLKEIAASEDIARREAGNRELANLYYRIRNYDEAIACYDKVVEVWDSMYRAQEAAGAGKEDLQRLAEIAALHYYNAACSNSLGKHFDRAKELLRRAIQLHSIHLENIERDGDLAPLRADESYPEFRKELERMFDDLSL